MYFSNHEDKRLNYPQNPLKNNILFIFKPKKNDQTIFLRTLNDSLEDNFFF